MLDQNMKNVCLTFDDGLLNTYEVAFPLLEKLGLTATAFIVSGALTGDVKPEDVRPADKSPFMNWDQVRELARKGWEIGSHSHTHRVFDTISWKEAEVELAFSKTLLSEFKPVSFAYPAGHHHYSNEQASLARSYYQHVRDVTMNTDPNRAEPFIHGYPVNEYPGGIKFDQSGWYITVHHRILDVKLFELWLREMLNQGFEFKQIRDMV